MKCPTLVYYIPNIDRIMSVKVGLKFTTITGIAKAVRIPTNELVGSLEFFQAVFIGVV